MRPINEEFISQVLIYIKQVWFKNGCKPVSPTYAEIASALGENPKTRTEKVMRAIHLLGKRGLIKINQGKGRTSNTYEFIKDDAETLLTEVREEAVSDVERLMERFNDTQAMVVQQIGSMKQEILKLRGQIAFYENLLADLEFFADIPEGGKLFKTGADTTLLTVLADLKNK